MKTTPVTHADLARSVIAVPPLARRPDLSLDRAANRALISHLEAGGIRSLMYGGNANFYHLAVSAYAETVDMLAELVGPETWLLPSAGPDFGKLIDQAAILRARAFPTAMLLPMTFPFTDAGLADGIRRFTDAIGKPAVVYIKADPYLKPATLGALQREGRLVAIKYAVVREDPSRDAYLDALLKELPHAMVVSGIGERPAIVHLRDFGLTSFTTGSGCIAPHLSMALLGALMHKRYDEAEPIRARFLPLEDARDAISPIRVLHDAVTLSGVADCGPMLPMLTGLGADERARVAPVARELLARDRARAASPRAA
ncbi:MAG: dihydrodipicolinate synthase family protein [Betaproteobacteria bacterium]